MTIAATPAGPDHAESAIAIVGMAARFPGADDVAQFWRNLLASTESVRFFSDEELIASGEPADLVHDSSYVPSRGALNKADWFDSEFFGFTDGEAGLTDLQQRLLLETVWRAFEDAARVPGPRVRTGIFVGARENRFAELASQSGLGGPDRASLLRLKLGSESDYLATSLAYRLDLRGPAVTVQTACSSSLVAVHLACRALLAGDCDLALAGGVSIRVPLNQGYLWERGLIDSRDGHCRAFDDAASGTVGGDGVGMVLLRRLSDAVDEGDLIHAVIAGSAINNDGHDKLGFTAPSVPGQIDLMRTALAASGIEPRSVGYVECHGTATKLGDPIELLALHSVFGGEFALPCHIGSVKSNIGHLDAAAGVAGLIKAALIVRHGVLAPSLHVRTPNRAFHWSKSSIRVCTQAADWPAGRAERIAAVSSLGLGGTNAFVLLSQAPGGSGGVPPADDTAWPLPLSASSAEALSRTSIELAATLETATRAGAPSACLRDVSYSLGAGRTTFRYRRTIVCRSVDEAIDKLRRETKPPQPADNPPRCVFLFPGHGVSPLGAGRDLYPADRVFAGAIDRVASLVLDQAGWDLREVVCAEAGTGTAGTAGTAVTQVSLFALSYAAAEAAMDWGVRPAGVIGHSAGEVAAACVAGVLSLPDAVSLIAARGRLCEDRCPRGAMLAVALSPERLAPLARQAGCYIGAVNGPDRCVATGPAKAIAGLERRLRGERIACAPLKSDRAYHSPAMRPAAEAIGAAAATLAFRPPSIAVYSTLTGTNATHELSEAGYWERQLLEPVAFDSALRACAVPGTVYLDAGPGQALSRLATAMLRRAASPGVAAALLPAGPDRDAKASFLGALGALWAAGSQVRWDRRPPGARRVSLPGHPLTPRHFPVPKPAAAPSAAAPAATVPAATLPAADPPAILTLPPAPAPAATDGSNDDTDLLVAIFEEVIGTGQLDHDESFFAMGGDSLMAVQVVARINDSLGAELTTDEFFSHPTISELASRLSRPRAG
ncbi:MAG TPA: beta-ketoacyl synthase N-terminal-like domain-containing protein [Streptosporangiaceae bacterium]|nr:beta-ketoacyl synthase N-terminal-like domain-containing protein [Streptosporangiaceae bacterium]